MRCYTNRVANPFRQLQQEMNQVLHGFQHFAAQGAAAVGHPRLNVWEEGEQMFVEAELPGLKLEDLEILVQEKELSIKGEVKPAAAEQTVHHLRERAVGSFERVVRLPYAVDADKVSAVLKDGVLTVTLPKAAIHRARKISVSGA